MRGLLLSRPGTEPDTLSWTDVPDPVDPGPTDVLVRVSAVAVNWADVLERSGRYPGAPTAPYVLGHDMSGVVVAVGAEVDEHAVGDRVFGVLPTGAAAAEMVVAPQHLVHRTPDGLSDLEAAGAAGPYLTADVALITMGGLTEGQSVLVQAGAGAFGGACIQLAVHRGAGQVIATAGGEAKVAAAMDLGADHGIDYTSEDFVPIVRHRTRGLGVDLVAESVGGDVLDRSIDCVRPGGRVVSVGSTSGHGSRALRLHMFFERGILFGGFTLGVWLTERPELVRPSVVRVLEAFESGVRPPVSAVFGPVDAHQAFMNLAQRQSIGRTVIDLSGSSHTG